MNKIVEIRFAVSETGREQQPASRRGAGREEGKGKRRREGGRLNQTLSVAEMGRGHLLPLGQSIKLNLAPPSKGNSKFFV